MVCGEFGPFVRRLMLAVEETNASRALDDIISRALSAFELPAAEESMMMDAASRAARVVVEEALRPSLSSSYSVSSRVVWCRVGELALRVIRDVSRGCETMPVLLLRRVAWRDDGAEAGVESSLSPSPMVSDFAFQWGAVLMFLSLLAKEMGSAVHDESTVSSLLTINPQPLPLIAADCVMAMIERNQSLLREASGANQPGMTAEVSCLAANNFVWIRKYSKPLSMENSLEVEELLTQCLVATLQDIVDNCVEEMHYMISLYITPSNVSGSGGRQRGMTDRVLASRLTAIRGLFNALVPSLPRSEMMSLVLEQSLRPVVYQLLEGERNHDMERSGVATGVLKRVGNMFLHAETGLGADTTHNEAEPFSKKDGDDNSNKIALAQRLCEVLHILENEYACGTTICEQSPSFRTLHRLLPTMNS